jgi:hypothetical protein
LVPVGASVFDGFTCRSLRTLNSRLYHVHFDIAAVLDVIDHDEVSVDLFAERDPAAAASIADYLTLWRGFLSGLRALASEAALFEDSFVGRAHLLPTAGSALIRRMVARREWYNGAVTPVR